MLTSPSRFTLSCSIRFSSIMVVVLLFSACGSKSPEVVETEAPARLAKLLEVGLADNNDFLNYPAVIQSQDQTSLSFNVGGMVTELFVVEAQNVEAGEVIATLDSRDFVAKLEVARAQYENDNMAYQRAVSLMKEDAIAKNELEKRKSQWEVSRAQLDTAEKALEDSVIMAPFDGVVAKVSISKREVVQAGSPAIDILGNGGLKAIVNIPSSIIANSGSGEPTTDSYVILNAAPDRRIPVAFKEATLEADSASQTYEVAFTFDAQKDLTILPGMSGVVWFRDPTQRVDATTSKISIPLTAVATDGDQKYVWLVDSNTMKVMKRNIVLEENIGTTVNVLGGLTVGDTIVSAGVAALAEGTEVTPWVK